MTEQYSGWGGPFIIVPQYQHYEIWVYLRVHDPTYLQELEAAA